eukprot:4816948-Amphidinium_carterae.1
MVTTTGNNYYDMEAIFNDCLEEAIYQCLANTFLHRSTQKNPTYNDAKFDNMQQQSKHKPGAIYTFLNNRSRLFQNIYEDRHKNFR